MTRPLDPPCGPDCPTCWPDQATLDVILRTIHHAAIRAIRAGATSDQLETAVRRGLLDASPHRYNPDPKNRDPQ